MSKLDIVIRRRLLLLLTISFVLYDYFDWVSLLAYPNLFGTKVFVIVVVVKLDITHVSYILESVGFTYNYMR
jgi:hypothetical protein